MHTPVLLQQAIGRLNIKRGGRYIDATFGEGGYSKAISDLGGIVLGIDLDQDQISRGKVSLPNIGLVCGNFADVEKIAKENNFFPVDGIVLDLGLSMCQLSDSGRGFSYFNKEERLDMRIDDRSGPTVKEIIKSLSIEELYQALSKNSEELKSKEIAVSIKAQRKMETVADLVGAIDRAVGHPAKRTYARVFQALRIEANNEFKNLKEGLKGSLKVLKPGGRLAIISFHSLEDRVIKNFIKENKLTQLDKKPIRGVRKFERSAKLRVVII